MNRRAKRILITAGPTWVAIDPVRVISNTGSGETGITLARRLAQTGCRVTLLLGPAAAQQPPATFAGITLRRFRFFDELARLFDAELKKKYDAVIHTAAVSDYKPAATAVNKIRSDRPELTLRLVRTPKLIARISRFASQSFAVGFKFEPGAAQAILIKRAQELLETAELDMVVANTAHKGRYAAWLVTISGVSEKLNSKNAVIEALVQTVTGL
ncbi:MAG TPA: phosphopantothenoylcysteine decarboxylase [Candidatus Omnitrophota bacterium]|nr:phosphopantothenoylcysteine decarboxylase [Candidatus Omnitrophota bacterium]HRZ15117.1 phosphopantothenoylcysteine decarboxylase [Candidatus Omnitrophota bacterium]